MEENNKKAELKGIKILTLSGICAVFSFVLLLFVGYNLHRVVQNYKVLAENYSLYSESRDYIDVLQRASDNMTGLSRSFVTNKDPVYMERYFEIIDEGERGKAAKWIKDYFSEMEYSHLKEELEETHELANTLVDYQIHSIKLMSQVLELDEGELPKQVKEYELLVEEEMLSDGEKNELASDLMFGKEYWNIKDQMDSNIKDIVSNVSDSLEKDTGEELNRMWDVIWRMILSCIALIVLLIVFFILTVILVIHPLRNYIQSVKENRPFDICGAYEFKYLASTYNEMFRSNQASKDRMSFELEHDSLTNAYSRRAFEQKKKELSQAKLPLALLLIDVDKFKDINDTYGHEMGDTALKKVAAILQRFFRSEDIVARVGGDEFAVLLLNTYSNEGDAIGEKINKINRILQNPDIGEPKLSLSVGIAYSENGYNDEIFKQADAAVYKTKENGRCGYSIYH